MCRSSYGPPTPSPYDSTKLRELAKGRAVTDWSQFPIETRKRYEAIARCYPGVQLYATGSRVSGKYADKGDDAAREARALAGRKKLISDFDFIAPPGVKPALPLPAWADRVLMPGGNRVAIPIAPARSASTGDGCVGCKQRETKRLIDRSRVVRGK